MVNRPLVALGLVAVALSLLTVLVADMQQAVEDPQFELSEKGAEAAAKAGEKLAPHADDVVRESNADSITLPDGATLTLPEGTEIDGRMIKLAQSLAWTFPAGTELENLSLELPAGLGFEIPKGTWVDGDTFVFPAGSTLRLDDGTVLELPNGGRLTMPGASSSEMARMLDHGHGTTREGSVFSAPSVTSEGDWPVVFPAGTEFTLPDGMTLPDGTLASETDVQFPPGSTLETSSADGEAGAGSSLFDKFGAMEFGKDAATPKSDKNAGGGGLPALGGSWWLWALLAAALLVAAWLVWHYRDRLRRALGGATGATRADDAPARITYAIDDRPEGLPLALAPGTTGTIHIAVQAKRRVRAPAEADSWEGDHTADGPPSTTRTEWVPTRADVRLALDGKSWTNRTVTTKGARIELPSLGPGTHRITATLTGPDIRGTVTLDTELHVAPWNEQVARDYQRLLDQALATLELPDGVTPRLLGSALRARTEPEDDARLDALIRTFETANYGHAEVDEADWIYFTQAVNGFVEILAAVDAARPGHARAPRDAFEPQAAGA